MGGGGPDKLGMAGGLFEWLEAWHDSHAIGDPA